MGFWTIWENVNKNTGENERLALKNRFHEEGLDVRSLTEGQQLPHIWRWLVDAETNCLSLRRQIDKLHRQHEQDLKEVEEYLEHVWKLSNDRLKQLDSENKSLKKQINCKCIIDNNNESKGNSINRNGLVKQNNNLCDSLKLKSNSKQIIQISNDDNMNYTNDYNNENELNAKNSDNKTITTSRRRNTIQTICETDNNYKTQSEQHLQTLQEMCQQFKNIIDELEDRIIDLERANTSLVIDNETLSYKLSECQSQSDQLEHQLLKLNDKKAVPMSASNDMRQSPVPIDADITEEPTLASLQLLLAARLSNAAQNDTNLVKQLYELKSDKQRLEEELCKRSQELKELLHKYERRKTRHKEMLFRLRSHTDRENRDLQQMLSSMEYKYKSVEEELQKHRKYCRIAEITAISEEE